MLGFFDTWYVSVVPLVLVAGLMVGNVIKSRNVLSLLNGTIRDEKDLRLVRGAINFSMIGAVVFLVIWGAMVLAIVALWVTGCISYNTALVHVFVYSVPGMVMGLVGRELSDKPIRSLTVTAEDPAVAERFELSLIQWREARLKLPE